jgi:hypothetical protein
MVDIITQYLIVANNGMHGLTITTWGVGTHKVANGITLQNDRESFLVIFHFFI